MELIKVCKNLWCKAHFSFIPEEGLVEPTECRKCQSFSNELSGGVTWAEKKYEGSRFDGRAHEISINVQKSNDRRW